MKCKGITLKGNPCSRTVKEGDFCWQHNVTTTSAPEIRKVPNRKEGKMNSLAHFLREIKELPDFSARVVTNMPFVAEEGAYEVSRLTHAVEQIGESDHRLLAVDIGSQTMPLFVHRAVELGVKFRLMSIRVKALKAAPEYMEHLLSRSNFAWSNDKSACFIKFDGVEGWGLEPLGLLVSYHAKLAKRLNEVARVSSHEHYGPVSMREFKTPEGMHKTYFDGMNIITQSFADALGFEEFRGNIRILTPLGLIKGDFVVVPDENLGGVDVVYHTENLKKELKTDGWYLTTCKSHAPTHELKHDDQSRSNFRHFITRARVLADLHEFEDAYAASVEEGDLCDYMEYSERSFDDPIAVDYERFGTSQRIEEIAEFLPEIGIVPASFANITYVRLNSIKNMMEARRHYTDDGRRTDFFDKMHIPASNAMSGAVVTYEALTMMGNVKFAGSDGTMTFLDGRYGIVMPGSRFKATHFLHGGWDLDDSVSVYRTKVYCSDATRLTQMVDSGILDPNIIVPGEKSEAVEVGVMIRLPNGPGEYSIEAIDHGAFGYIHRNDETVEVVDLTKAPYDVDTVFGRADITGVPDAKEHTEYTREVAGEAISAQIINPGVGGFVNLLMAWGQTFGIGTLPDQVIGRVEDVVDATQQGADYGQFMAIRNDVARLWEEYAQKVVETGTSVDRSLWTVRIPPQVGRDKPVGDAIAEAGLVGRGGDTELQVEYQAAIDHIGTLAKFTAAEARSRTPLAVFLRVEKFGPRYQDAARDLYMAAYKAMNDLDMEFRREDAKVKDNAVMRRAVQIRRREATEALMDRIVNGTLARKAVDPHRLVLALYKYITRTKVVGGRTFPHGLVDRIFVQPSSEGTPSMMHLFVEALEKNGILIDPVGMVN